MSGRVAVYLLVVPVVPTRLEDQCINTVRRAEVRSPKLGKSAVASEGLRVERGPGWEKERRERRVTRNRWQNRRKSKSKSEAKR